VEVEKEENSEEGDEGTILAFFPPAKSDSFFLLSAEMVNRVVTWCCDRVSEGADINLPSIDGVLVEVLVSAELLGFFFPSDAIIIPLSHAGASVFVGAEGPELCDMRLFWRCDRVSWDAYIILPLIDGVLVAAELLRFFSPPASSIILLLPGGAEGPGLCDMRSF